MTRVILARCFVYRDGFVRRKLFTKVTKLFFFISYKASTTIYQENVFFSLIFIAYIFEAIHGERIIT